MILTVATIFQNCSLFSVFSGLTAFMYPYVVCVCVGGGGGGGINSTANF